MVHLPGVEYLLPLLLAAAIPVSILIVLRLMPTGTTKEIAMRELDLREKTLDIEARKVALTEQQLGMNREDHDLKMRKSNLELEIRKAEWEAAGGANRRPPPPVPRSQLMGGR